MEAATEGSVWQRRWVRRTGVVLLMLGVLIAGVVSLVIPAFEFDDPAEPVSVDAPATRALMVPPLLSGTLEDGTRTFDLSIEPSSHEFVGGIATATYAYNGASILGPTLEIHEGDTVAMNVTNELDEVTTTHWHGGDVPAVADGGPHSVIEPGTTWSPVFDVIQPAATLWYHPHRMGLTAEQVYRGAAGLLIVRDTNPLTKKLPQTYGFDDIPVVLQDRNFTPEWQLDFSIDAAGRGRLMENLTVNGTIDPFVEVPSGMVRLRLLNGSQARVYKLSVVGATMSKIASDGGYLSVPVELKELALAPGDRAEIVVNVEDEPVSLMDSAFERVLELRPNGQRSESTSIPRELAVEDRIAESEITLDRAFVMGEVGNGWGINGQQMNIDVLNEKIRFGDTERWRITSTNGQHVFHVHQTQFQILSINGEAPPPEDTGWEDSVWVNGDREVVLAARFNTYINPEIPYMYHCHILDHEDLGMMGQFKVLEEPT